MKKNQNSMRILKKGSAVNIGDESTVTGESTTTGDASTIMTGNTDIDPNDLKDEEVGEEIMANAAQIPQKIEDTGNKWSSCSAKTG